MQAGLGVHTVQLAMAPASAQQSRMLLLLPASHMQWPKSCGHVRNKRVVAREEAVARIRAACDARWVGKLAAST